jgi:LEA14-like dessication related protein
MPSEPAPAVRIANPAAQISFDRFEFEAGDTGSVTLFYLLEAVNPRSIPAELDISGWKFTVNGREIGSGTEFFPGDGEKILGPEGVARFPVRLELDTLTLSLTEFPPQEAIPVELNLDLLFTYNTEETIYTRQTAQGAFPLIREPVFTITGIAVKQAELINTRFKVSMKIDNPNFFPVDLSTLVYELYGNGRFWADGKEKGILHIPAGETSEVEVLLVMNFIDMNRELLNQIVALRQVSCRFTGGAQVCTALDYLPPFRVAFDQSGLSRVIE